MVQFISSLLSPLLEPMGVSNADLLTYLEKCIGYIYVILIALVLAIVVMVAAHFILKKGTRHVARWTAGIAWVLVVLIISNLICFGPLQGPLSMIMNSAGLGISEEAETNSKAVIQEVGEEGMVLLKNSGLLPLSENVTALNVFGWDSTAPIFGGTGSGSGDSSTAVGILDSLQKSGYQTNQSLTDMYVGYKDGRSNDGLSVSSTDWTLPEPTIEYYTSDLMQEAESFSDVAVICIGRSGGEGADEPMDMNAVIHGTYDPRNTVSVVPDNYNYYNCVYQNNGNYDDFDPGEHYLQLSNTEEAMIELVCDRFDKVIVVINANNVMELGWVDEYDSIGAVILAPGTGATGMTALGEIIKGTVNPSGRTVDTFVYDLTNTPSYNNFGNFSYTNVDDMKKTIAAADPAYEGGMAFVNYVEGIYVGYKYYETAADEGFIDFPSVVQYPFGYGLSYTTFEQKIENFSDDGDSVSFDVLVTNTGKTAGKTPVEIYFTPPYTNGGIEKASVNLIDFGKTGNLEPGTSERLSFVIAKEDMASYDSECIKTSNGGYVLEAGTYVISARSDSHNVLSEVSFSVSADIDYSKNGCSSDGIPATNQFGYAKGNVTYLSRADGFANYNAVTAAPNEKAYQMDSEVQQLVSESAVGYYDPTLYDDPSDVMPTTGAQNGIVLSQLTGKAYDDPMWEQLLDQLTVEDMSAMINVGGFGTMAIDSVGKVETADCDGPAGVNNLITGVTGTIFPSEVLMAQTWSKEMATKIGDAMGQEYEDVESYGWYGPAMNTHRSAFAGRNFEYYSEDGLLAGYFAAKQISAAADHGVYAYIKHFALNDQESNRETILLTYSNEQAIREIYLKPFELCVKNFDSKNTCLAVMSSMNWIGTKPTCANPELLNTALRDEWGFQGMVITDYDGSYGYMISDHCVRNGNDMMLGFGMFPYSNGFDDADAATCALAMRQACKNILYTIGNSGYYVNATGDVRGMDTMTKTIIALDVAVAAIAILIEAFVVIRWIKKNKKGTNPV